MCDRTDWPCIRTELHDAPHGCVHVSSTGSEIPDRHDSTSGGEH